MSSGSEYSHPSRKVVSTRVYESTPVVPAQQEVVETTQTEEWTTKKKTDKLVTKQIKTRVKREILVTEDGEILEDSGPLVTTDTTEETKTDEQEDVEHKTSGLADPGPGWTLVPGSRVINETKKNNTTTHKTTEEKNETEITEEIGGLTREDIARALKDREFAAIKVRRDSSSTVDSKPKLQSSRTHKVVDTEEIDEVSEFKDGHLTTETKKKSNREEHFDGTSSEDEREAIGKKVWPAIRADDRRASSSPTTSSHSSSRNIKNNDRSVAFDDSHRSSTDSGHRKKEKVRATSPSSFNSSNLQQVDSSPTFARTYRAWPESETLRSFSSNRTNNYIKNKCVKEEEEEGAEEEEKTTRSKTFKWVKNHFGSQDFNDSGIVTETSGISTNSSPTFSKEYYVPIRSEEDGSSYRRHHSKRQQMPTEKKVKYKAPEPPIPPPSSKLMYEMDSRPSSRLTNKTDSQYTTTGSTTSTLRNSSPKKQYFLGEDTGFGQRFTGMIDACSRRPADEHHQNSDSAYSTLSLTRPYQHNGKPEATKQCSTLGRQPVPNFKEKEISINGAATNGKVNNRSNENHGKKLKSAVSTPNVFRSVNVDTNAPPSVSDIIHSLRSKEFLQKENSAVSIRDDDSVFDIRSVSNFSHHKPTTLRKQLLDKSRFERPVTDASYVSTNKTKTPATSKQHVIKIIINSDGSQRSSPVNSPNIIANGNDYNCPSQKFDFKPENNARPEKNGRRLSQTSSTGGSDSIVKNAINNLMKSKVDKDNGKFDSSYNSLARTTSPRNGTSNLAKSRVYLAASSPNVSKLVTQESNTILRQPKQYEEPKRSCINNRSKSQSINNLHYNDGVDWSPQQPHVTYGKNGNVHSNGKVYNSTGNRSTRNTERAGKEEYYHHQSNNWKEKNSRNYSNNYNYVPYVTPETDYSPLSSPTNYTNGHLNMKLPSPIPPPLSRSSSSPPSSPLPNLTRPFSPNYNRNYDSSNYYNERDKLRASASRTPSFNSRSPSPPSFVRRPPSPVLPSRSKRASSIGDDVASSISGRSQSTNGTGSAGSRGGGNLSDISQPSEKVVTTTRRKVTTTTTTKREVEQPDSDYYYEKAISGTLNRDSNNKLNGRASENGLRTHRKEYINSR
ncbi:hypothetical protein CHUAL_004540 [Chamberlinius hualienensis]